ncbi:MAG: HDIG domain-containing protein [candidate division Zixibacteria bacterium]|nr:HDIG domain-containing protein [candidate division Zixibacteria bacterium]
MKREEALGLVKSKVEGKNLVKHMLAVEAIMKRVAEHFDEDVQMWSLTGLLHDLDYDETVNDFDRHSLLTCEWLKDYSLDERILYAIKCHPRKVEPKSKMDWTLFAADPLSGLIVAAALMHPTKKLKNVTVEFVLNRFKEKRFAAGANREDIKACEMIGLSLDEFVKLALEGMQSIDEELGL